MALYLDCDRCGSSIDAPGSLVFSPPSIAGNAVSKFHICESCWYVLDQWIKEGE